MSGPTLLLQARSLGEVCTVSELKLLLAVNLGLSFLWVLLQSFPTACSQQECRRCDHVAVTNAVGLLFSVCGPVSATATHR